MPTNSNEYWFPAKRYGWGWGLPSRWQGWVVLAIYAVLLLAGIVGLHPGTTQWSFVVYVMGVTALLALGAGLSEGSTVSNLDGRQSGSYSAAGR